MKLILQTFIISLFVSLSTQASNSEINIVFNSASAIQTYAANQFKTRLAAFNYSIQINSEPVNYENNIFLVTPENLPKQFKSNYSGFNFPELGQEGFQIVKKGTNLFVPGNTDRGCLYGSLDIIEQLTDGIKIPKIKEKKNNPAFSFRAIKFNLPWSPYRPGPATNIHLETCKDLEFWKSFLDMMVNNRFNALSLWNTHPFTYMIKAENYPKATPFSDAELNEWKTFWKTLFKMAKDRGIETYLVNWNIVVSPEFAENYGANIHDDRSQLVKNYTRESVTQLINEYENLSGLGVTLADWMGNWGENKMTPLERENWIEETFVEGINNANRKVKFIHRAVLAGDPELMRNVIDNARLPDKTNVEIKFNWSHAYSTPKLSLTHANDQGSLMNGFWEPKPENYFISWMIRNEDFFVLRWGDPDFIRKHIHSNNHDYVDGYFIGSEGYIPAKDISQKPNSEKTWNYAFEKQWLLYHLWGRILYNPNISNKELLIKVEQKYPETDVINLLKAYTLASKVPENIASFYKGTWDFTLYSEGFLAAWQAGFDDEKSPFISIEELMKHETLDKNLLSISEYCSLANRGIKIKKGQITPNQFSNKIISECNLALKTIESLRKINTDITLKSELADLETWCYLGFYFSDKIKAGIELENYLLTKKSEYKNTGIIHLRKCVNHWNKIIELTENRYQPMPYVSMGHHEPRWPDFQAFHWKYFLKDVKADIDFAKNLK